MKALLFILVSFAALTAIVSGFIMINNPDGNIMNLRLNLLEGTAFKDFRIPGLILAIVVGGINLLAVFYNLLRHQTRYNWAMAGGTVISGWIIIQMILIGAFHWLHVLYLVIGILIILISYQLKGKWAV
jgi:uncharacterized membrane protein